MAEDNKLARLGEADFMRLLLQHENALRAFARSLLPDWNAVDDVFQDASVIMWKKFDQLDTGDGFLPWGKVIVRFHCYRYHEQKKKSGAVFSNELIAILAGEAENLEDAEYSQRHTALASCLEGLRETDRELVLAPYLGHGRIKELAEAANTSANSLYKKIGRLRDRLRQCITSKMVSPLSS
ncbi:sigma-70 family RNA polymerase sigma factor [Verrucomicrobiaceae bacterium 5K15]|uniref:Sigma-70 family RNA polymerase sigma factor n=1 Tax=Oceaniferula flava TaxID=2800421 RepID=A0AAE2SFW4_9BACT|nr:sigma-70 family RNA polymerase sigma factor [Oceaniferula flavus]MBK1855606.1 sigma-70 family RNA polymerase sigma factor [Oceaniferula flavus]MBM1136912.1 sigma-70 family RNA polymerase sigma factor [Oceaniferula flavus]